MQPQPKPVTTAMGSGNVVTTASVQNKSNMQAVSWDQYNAGGSGSNATTNTNTTSVTYTKPVEKKEDPHLKEKQSLANSLFAGVSSQTTKTMSGNKGKAM